MSTFTTNYSLEKTDFDEASGPDAIAENMMKVERILTNLELGSNTGRQNTNFMAHYRNASMTAISLNSQDAFDHLNLTWTSTRATSAWTTLFDLDTNYETPSLGLAELYTSGSFDFYHAGYYRITWNLRVQTSNTTMSDGLVRATLFGWDGSSAPFGNALAMIGSPVVIAMNTMTDLTDIGAEQVVRLVQQERTDEDGKYNGIVAGKNQRTYYNSTAFWRYFAIGVAHNNTSSATITPLLNESYVNIEFVRGL